LVYEMGIPEISNYIYKNTNNEDSIFVWGFLAEIYTLSNRKPATRYSCCNVITGLIPWVNVGKSIDTSFYQIEGTLYNLLKDLDENKPKYIIDSSTANIRFYGKYPINKYTILHKYIGRNYVLDKIIKDIHIYKRNIYQNQNL
ncbi:MAG: hypothetical protein JXR73_10370, partial [Candidatus Omnitrophica bacterium]|nr:hypothetical protein [Candidatus Omnitrophota bacterium]